MLKYKCFAFLIKNILCFMCMGILPHSCLWTMCMFAIHRIQKRKFNIVTWNWSYKLLWAIMWVLERVSVSVKHWAIILASTSFCFDVHLYWVIIKYFCDTRVVMITESWHLRDIMLGMLLRDYLDYFITLRRQGPFSGKGTHICIKQRKQAEY